MHTKTQGSLFKIMKNFKMATAETKLRAPEGSGGRDWEEGLTLQDAAGRSQVMKT